MANQITGTFRFTYNMDNLNHEQIVEFKKAFRFYDRDGDGKVAVSELGVLMRALGACPTNDQLRNWVAEHNLQSGFDFPTLLTLMAKALAERPCEADIVTAFKVFDKQDKGLISISDLRHILNTLGEDLGEEELDRIIAIIPRDENDNVDYRSFAKVLACP